MKSLITLLFFIFLTGSILPALAVVPGLSQQKQQSNPPLKLFDNQPQASSQPPLQPSQANPALIGHQGEELRDIQGPINLPEPRNYWLPIAIAVLILLLAALAFFLIKRRKKTASPLPAHEVALAEIAKAKSWMSENNGLFYAQKLSGILRQYIESRFFVQSTRQTTHELLSTLQSDSAPTANAPGQHLDELQACLEQCDMAKFAHLPPTIQAMAKMESSVVRFVETTKVQPEGDTV